MLIRVTKGVRNQAQEMINTLHITQRALRHSMNPRINTDLASFLMSRLTDRRRIKSNKGVQAHHISRKEDTGVRRLFPHSQIDFYHALNIGHVRLCTRSYSDGKSADDSNIIFRLNGMEHFGRIRSIFSVDREEPLLFVAHLSNMLTLSCPIDDSENYTCASIQINSDSHWSFALLEIKDFVEKSVFYESHNGRYTFFRFPNLTHCS